MDNLNIYPLTIPLFCVNRRAGFFLYFVGWYAILDTRRSRVRGWRCARRRVSQANRPQGGS
ncbi:hypothetical protein [Phascolarctobacterium faecium]|uniref:hypothetical protein n=1 Tax=Phascolarctobacterium faecium TaxID=33025 RepID=UPI003AF0FD7B